MTKNHVALRPGFGWSKVKFYKQVTQTTWQGELKVEYSM